MVPAPPPTVVEKELEKPPVKQNEPVVATAKQVKFGLKSVPEGAEVFDGEMMIGTTPFSVTRERGAVGEFRFVLAGHKSASRKLRFEEDSSMTMQLEKEKEKEKAKEPVKEAAKEPREPKPAKAKAPAKGLHNDPYSDVKELKDLPD